MRLKHIRFKLLEYRAVRCSQYIMDFIHLVKLICSREQGAETINAIHIVKAMVKQ